MLQKLSLILSCRAWRDLLRTTAPCNVWARLFAWAQQKGPPHIEMRLRRGVPVASRASQRSIHDSSCNSGLLAQDTASAHHLPHSDAGSPLYMHPEHCSVVLQGLFDPLCHHKAVLHSKRTCAASLTAASTELAELPELLLDC